MPGTVDDNFEGQREIAGVRDGMAWTAHAERALPEQCVRQREAQVVLQRVAVLRE
jgi:hypothetical protein